MGREMYSGFLKGTVEYRGRSIRQGTVFPTQVNFHIKRLEENKF